MLNSVEKIIRLSNSPNKEKYNILTFPTHERYETQLCKTGHNFYSFNTKNNKKWNLKQSPYPDNYYTLPENEILNEIQYDFILSQSKFWQLQVAYKINQTLDIPIISLEHTWPLVGVQADSQLDNMRNMIGNVNVFISEESQEAWKIPVDGHVIHHGIDTDVFQPLDISKESHILTVANDFVNRDYCLNYSGWKRVTEYLPTKLVGETKGLSSASESVEDLVEEYNKCAVYFNSSTLSPIPTSLLEAMSCGCAVVSTATCMIPAIIKNGYNGFISNDEAELQKYIKMLINDEELRAKLGVAARKTIVDRFSEKDFIKNWNRLFNETYEVFYR
jgi:glycosyltransferase involved in cell wall biosynthesis